MFRDFLSHFGEKPEVVSSGDPFKDFILQLSGKTFGNGLFRSFSKENIGEWRETITEAYPAFKGKFMPFGYDWLGVVSESICGKTHTAMFCCMRLEA